MNRCDAIMWALDVPNLPATPRALLAVMARHSDGGVCPLPQKELAALAGVSARQVVRVMAELVNARLVKRERRGGVGKGRLPDVYRLAVDANLSPDIVARDEMASSQAQGDKTALGTLPQKPCAPSTMPNLHGAKMAPSLELNPDRPEIISPPPYSPPPTVSGRLTDRELVAAAMNAAGDGVNRTVGATQHAADLRAMIEPSSGAPCDFERDVLPAIQAEAANAIRRKKPICSWSWVRERALANRDRRLAGNPDVKAPTHDNRIDRDLLGADAGSASGRAAKRGGPGASQPRSIGIEYARRLFEAEQREALAASAA